MLDKDLVAASAEPLVLALLTGGESYGYAILQEVHRRSKERIEWTDGMLYPVLHRLERKGFVRSRWRQADTGRRRKYYSILAAGRKELARRRAQWEVVNETLTSVWSPSHA